MKVGSLLQHFRERPGPTGLYPLDTCLPSDCNCIHMKAAQLRCHTDVQHVQGYRFEVRGTKGANTHACSPIALLIAKIDHHKGSVIYREQCKRHCGMNKTNA